MILRISTPVIVFAGLTALSTSSTTDMTSNSLNVKTAEASVHAERTVRANQRAEEVLMWVRGLEDGERTPNVIQKEISDIAGDSEPIQWNTKNIKGPFKLTQVASHYQNLESHFEILHIWTLADGRTSEDQVTHYTNRVQAADEQLIQSELVIPRWIENKNGRLVFAETGRVNYRFHLKRDELRGNFSLREPVGAYELGAAQVNSFDPVGQLAQLGQAFEEVGEYQYEIPYENKLYNVILTPRITDLETLTIEVEVHEVRSLQTSRHVLVYEPVENI